MSLSWEYKCKKCGRDFDTCHPDPTEICFSCWSKLTEAERQRILPGAKPINSQPENTDTPKTLRCFRDGKWQVDELANTCDRLERELKAEKEEHEKVLQQLRDNTPACGACAEGFWTGAIGHEHTCGQPNPKVEIKEIKLSCRECGELIESGDVCEICEHSCPMCGNKIDEDTGVCFSCKEVVK